MKETEKALETDTEEYKDENMHMEGKENPIEKSGQAETKQSGEAAEEGKKAAKSLASTRGGLYLRTIIGGLILYYAYSILSDMQAASGTNRTLLYVFAAVFGIAGIWIVLDSLKRLFKKEYDE